MMNYYKLLQDYKYWYLSIYYWNLSMRYNLLEHENQVCFYIYYIYILSFFDKKYLYQLK